MVIFLYGISISKHPTDVHLNLPLMKQKLVHPIFILSLVLLILNDWVFKAAFHNEITGKLSDFTGLIVFPYLLSVCFPKYQKLWHWLTFFLFIWWKSEWAQPFIDVLHLWSIPLGRVVDYTDYLALISIYFSYKLLQSDQKIQLAPYFQRILLSIAILACVATSYYRVYTAPKVIPINKNYDFDFSKNELVNHLNDILNKRAKKINKTYPLEFADSTGTFHRHGQAWIQLLDAATIQPQDTLVFSPLPQTKYQIVGDSTRSQIRLLLAEYIPRKKGMEEEKAWFTKQFERQVIKKLRKAEKKK